MFATGKLGNISNRIFCDLTGFFTFQGTNKLWSDFIYAAMYFSDPILAENLER